MCLTEYGHISKTHIRSNQYDHFRFINTRVREKNSTMKPNTTFPALSADNLKNSPGQCRHTGQNTHTDAGTRTHTHTHIHNETSQATREQTKQLIISKDQIQKPLLRDTVSFKVLNWVLRCKALFAVFLWRPRHKLRIFF